MLADALAETGFPVLRFDYPGVGDSLDEVGDPNLADWVEAARRGEELLREWSGARRVVFLGQGLGAGVALLAAQQCDSVAGLALLASYSSGRALMRELAVSAPVFASNAGLKHRPCKNGALNILGFELPASLVADFQALDFKALNSAPAPRVLLVERPNDNRDVKFAKKFEQLGADVTLITYEGYERLISNPLVAAYPGETFASVIETLSRWRGSRRGGKFIRAPLPAAVLESGDFIEKMVRFGKNGSLGVFCRPKTCSSGNAFVFLNCGTNPHTGWRRMTVEHARFLAGHGIASLRIDSAGVGDSPAREGADHAIYCEEQIAETSEALDWLVAQGVKSITLFGVCSGAYQAVQTAMSDPRVGAIIIANPFIFVMEETRTVDELIHFYSRRNAEYFLRVMEWDGLMKLLGGKTPAMRIIRVVLNRLKDQLLMVMPDFVRRMLLTSQNRETIRVFEKLDAQGTLVTLVTVEGDVCENEMNKFFGRDGAALRHFKNVTRISLANADHNLTSPECDIWLRKHFLERAESLTKAGCS
jgi:pimeloyl-ACP methyl ester carboxylesterase